MRALFLNHNVVRTGTRPRESGLERERPTHQRFDRFVPSK